MSISFILTGKSSKFTTCFNSLILDSDKQYEAALLSLDTYNSIPNITEGKNNIFKYYNGENWKTITIDTGSYELDAINDEIKRRMIRNGDSDKVINIIANVSTLRSIVSIEDQRYQVDFNVENSIGTVLGFNNSLIGFGYNVSPNIIDIMQVNSILVNVDFIMGSYVNGSSSPVIYSFCPNVSPGYKIVEIPKPVLIYYPVSRHDISRIEVWLTDQNNNLVDLRGETLTMRIHVREIKPRGILKDILKTLKTK